MYSLHKKKVKNTWVHFIIKNNKNIIIITLNIKLNINHFYNLIVNNFLFIL